MLPGKLPQHIFKSDENKYCNGLFRCDHCQKLAPAWEELAKAFEKDEQVEQ